MELVTRDDFLATYKAPRYGKPIANQYDEWFPVTASPALAGLIGDLTTDGHVQGHPKLRFDYTSSRKEEFARFERVLKDLFGIVGSTRENVTNPYSTSYNYGVNSKPLTRILILLDVPTGNKVKTPFSVPTWIAENKELFRAYIGRVFTNDGSAYGANPRVTLELSKELSIADTMDAYLQQISDLMLDYFDITGSLFTRSKPNTRKDCDQTISKGFNIRRKRAIKRFHREISITDKNMLAEIETAIAEV